MNGAPCLLVAPAPVFRPQARAHVRCATVDTRRGFTLIELLIAIVIFSGVIFVTYQILEVTLTAERTITEATLYCEVGQAILTQMRRDLQGAAYHGLGRQVFLGKDQGDGDDAEDSLHFLTYGPVPAAPDDFPGEWDGEVASVGYVLKSEGEMLTLFRRVSWELETDGEDLGEEGNYFPIYDKVKARSLRYTDGQEWYDDWDSEERIPLDPVVDESAEDGAAPDGTDPPAGGTNPPPAGGTGTDGAGEAETEDDEEDEEEEEILPLPRAVEIVLHIHIGDERGLILDSAGNPLVEKYVMIVPLIAMDRLSLEAEDSLSADAGSGSGTSR